MSVVDAVGQQVAVLGRHLGVVARVLGESQQVLARNVDAGLAQHVARQFADLVGRDGVADAQVLQAQVGTVFQEAVRGARVVVGVAADRPWYVGVGILRRPGVQHVGAGVEQPQHSLADDLGAVIDLVALHPLEKQREVEALVAAVKVEAIGELGNVAAQIIPV